MSSSLLLPSSLWNSPNWNQHTHIFGFGLIDTSTIYQVAVVGGDCVAVVVGVVVGVVVL